ncbi:dihydrolipoyl dehydrogenase [Caviibacter abscessus]|uniref:dihydrolipoyl dehydrogenase n=1 Tax=Caviibacter abscessus TaxID=1766719 RepID=UPI00082CAE54|nr:dihydrolipoyl dehydrogenase [Caviibacter abscessus]
MATEVIMPKLGVDMQEGQILEWKKKEGDRVEEGEILLEIMSDKTNMELEAETSGVLLSILKGDGETVPVTEVIAYIGEQGEQIEKTSSEKASVQEDVKTEKVSEQKVENDYDIIVIGGGPAGYYSAIRAAQLDAKVLVIEKSVVGGTCLNRGCIPTKTYLKNAEMIDHINHAKSRGIILESENYKIDMNKTVDVKNEVVKTLTNGVKGLLKSYGIDTISGVGSVDKNKVVSVNGQSFRANKIIIATGSKVGKINIPGIESSLVMTSDDILDLRIVPETLAIIGGGVVGVELGQAFSYFGSKVTIIEMSDRLVPAADEEVSQVLRKSLESKGIKVLTSTKLNEIKEQGGRLTLKLEGKEDVIVDKALLSIGRVPDLSGLYTLDLELEKGKIKVNEYMETSIEGIYAPGDVNGIKMLAHAAFRMGEIAAENAVKGNHRKVKLASTPAAVYTMPEIGMVGLTESEARAKYDISVGKFSFAANGRAIASGETAGFVKVIADRKYGEILGVHIIGPAAAELINEASSLIEMEITIEEVAKTIHGHPTYSEAMFEACMDVLGEAIHLPKKINKKY